MSQMQNYMEAAMASMVAGTAITLPANWYVAPLSAYTDSGVTEISSGLTRFSMARSLANWAGTQGTGTTLASTGTSHTTSNNIDIELGTASGSATMSAIGLFDASTSGNCWMVWELETPLSISSSDVVTLGAGLVRFALGLTGGLSDYLSNKLIDLIFRAQAYTFPASVWNALYTAAPTNAGGGTEVGGGGGYARAEIESADWDDTADRASNANVIAHPQPTGSWGAILADGLFDASTLGNLLLSKSITPMTIDSSSPPPSFAVGNIGITFA